MGVTEGKNFDTPAIRYLGMLNYAEERERRGGQNPQNFPNILSLPTFLGACVKRFLEGLPY